MKQQGLAEPLKSESDEQSTLRSQLAKKERCIEELRKEIEVIIYNNTYVCEHNYTVYICNYVCSLICTYLYSFYVIIITFSLMIVKYSWTFTCIFYVAMVQLNLNLIFTHVCHESFWTNFSCHS